MTSPMLVDIADLVVEYDVRQGGRRRTLRAVDHANLSIGHGTSMGIVGESGCGKSTLASALMGLIAPKSGAITFDGERLGRHRDNATKRRIQMVFQDPTASLNPRMTIRATLTEVAATDPATPRSRMQARVTELIGLVQLPESVLDRYPRTLSGGQRQRVGIARALASRPDLLVLDEAVAALDVSVQASILQLLRDLRHELGLSIVFISHDLGVIRNVCDRVAVMYLGRFVEVGPIQQVLLHPEHPYTRALVDAAPRIHSPKPPGSSQLTGEPPSPLNPPAGCAFSPRCDRATDECRTTRPVLADHAERAVACIHPLGTLEPASSVRVGA
ncbi:ABC transporter ATP-binding protein [Mycolicibacterium baixiangningiae]|uniref:ABC transporter ATP-binding protein n=1 Tax=Mycolicibacterium baixiangningiae TaxID=2761578 RepID=UPI0018D0523B|nr:ABC transporter ATP-binding protein [Mycolicibacterium baixiangningiae]